MSDKAKDYHSYVFKDGKFIGAFEEMYINSEDVPWHQDSIPKTWSGKVGTNVLEAAFAEDQITSVMEVGCGYGYILANLRRPSLSLTGFDISATAVAKAKELHQGITFFVDDLINLKHKESYDLVICKENLWYLTDHYNVALESLERLVKPEGYLYIGLSFPALNGKYVGQDVIPNPESLIQRLELTYNSVPSNILLKKEM